MLLDSSESSSSFWVVYFWLFALEMSIFVEICSTSRLPVELSPLLLLLSPFGALLY